MVERWCVPRIADRALGVMASLDRSASEALRRVRRVCRRRFRNVERDLELIPRCLLVGDLDSPLNFGVIRGQLHDGLARGIVAEHRKQPPRTECSGCILREPGLDRLRVSHLRSDEEPRLAVAHPGYTDRRVDRRAYDLATCVSAVLTRPIAEHLRPGPRTGCPMPSCNDRKAHQQAITRQGLRAQAAPCSPRSGKPKIKAGQVLLRN